MGFSLFLIVLKSGLFSGSSSQHSFITSTTNFGVVSKAARRGRNGISDDLSAILDMISEMKSHHPLKRLSLQLLTFIENFYFLFKSLVKVELRYVFTINLFTIAENCTKK